jgi:NAD(P)-dependent dehydrogenase (short-subunit alcohol dehydrogenase family)
LDGTLLDVARGIRERTPHASAVPFRVDLADGDAARDAVREAVHCLGGELDVLVNNASALWLGKGPTSVKKLDLVHNVNARATLVCLQEAREALRRSPLPGGGSVVTLSPPIRLGRLDWISAHPAYTLSKYGMTLATLGEACVGQLRANCLWPRHTVATAATLRLERERVLPGAYSRGRSPDLVAQAVVRLALDPGMGNGRTVYDDQVLPGLFPVPTDAPLDVFAEPRWIVDRE